MKNFVFLFASIFMAKAALAATITCQVGNPSANQSDEKIITSEGLIKDPKSAILTEAGDTQYLLTISDVYTPENHTIISKDAMVLTFVVNGKSTHATVSDGNNLLYFGLSNSVGISCKRTN